MQYAFLIYRDEAAFDAERGNAAAMQQLGARHIAFSQEVGNARIAGAGLKSVALATTVRTAADGVQVVHDGPFADAKEQLGGFYVIDAPDLDAAIMIAKKIPFLKDGAVEIRPVLG
ncbi:YciI family protein [Bradyrhizobium diazoefficiens]|nr:YciI family protein [Bradyrhizobium diazoefficiens]MBR0701965.1 YciI family protein [Bradyrhizobium diazoefficiens]MBR0770388.1 YciI family protein [Bradyrhizobium diazoefficiens]